MSTIHNITYAIHRVLGPSNHDGSDPVLDLDRPTVLAGVGAGIVDVDEMSWDEHLLAHTRWVNSPDIKPVYMPGRDRIFFMLHTDDQLPAMWLGTGSFPLDITREDQLDDV